MQETDGFPATVHLCTSGYLRRKLCRGFWEKKEKKRKEKKKKEKKQLSLACAAALTSQQVYHNAASQPMFLPRDSFTNDYTTPTSKREKKNDPK